VRTTNDILRDYQHVIESFELVMGSKGVFTVEVDGETLFSKHDLGRHAEPGEVLRLFRERIVPGVPVYER
jgi:selenoprotein W-related protein